MVCLQVVVGALVLGALENVRYLYVPKVIEVVALEFMNATVIGDTGRRKFLDLSVLVPVSSVESAICI